MVVIHLLGLMFFASLGGVSSATSCLEKGFSSNLLCESCEELKRFNLEPLQKECEECCQQSSSLSDSKVLFCCLCLFHCSIRLMFFYIHLEQIYAGAVLEVCG